MFKKLFKLILILLIATVGYLLFWPVEFKPNAWYFAPGPEMTGILKPNNKLAAAEPFGPKLGMGVEDLVFDKDGNIYTAAYDSDKLFKVSADGSTAEIIAIVPKHSLGLALSNDETTVYIMNASEGLIKVENGKVTSLLQAVEGQQIMFGEEISITKDGIVYFSDGSKHPITSMGVIADRNPSGRVLRFEPKTGRSGLIVDEIDFANGITLSHDEKAILIAEYNQGRLLRYWLEGPKTGRLEKFVDPLPGMPDNISRGENGIYWVALYTTRESMEQLAQSPFMVKLAQRLPGALIRQVALNDRKSMIVGVNDDGKIVHFLQDGTQSQTNITSVVERNGYLYLGGKMADQLRRIKVPNGDEVETPLKVDDEKPPKNEEQKPTEKQVETPVEKQQETPSEKNIEPNEIKVPDGNIEQSTAEQKIS